MMVHASDIQFTALLMPDTSFGQGLSTVRLWKPCSTPINCLPSELLARIFFFCRVAEPAEVLVAPASNNEAQMPDLGWIKVTHVCSRWRAVAIASLGLWTDITFSLGNQWTQEMLARSNQAPLTLDGRDATLSFREQTRLIIDHLYRTAELRLTGKMHILVEALTVPMPQLRLLEICSNMDASVSSTRLPIGFLGEHAPLLQHFTVENPIAFPWGSPILSNLTTLVIRFHNPNQQPPSLTTLLGSLKKMMALEVLMLTGCLPRSKDVSFSPAHRTVDLPHLTNFSISGELDDCTSLLAHVTAPTTARLVLSSTSHNGISGLGAFCSALTTYLHASTRPLYRLVCALSAICPSVTLLFADSAERHAIATSPSPGRAGTPYDDARLSFLMVKEAESGPADVMRAICTSFATEHLLSIDLYADCPCAWTPQDWRSIMARAGGVRSVRAFGPMATSLATALPPLPGELASGGIALFPALQALALTCTDFRRTITVDGRVRVLSEMFVAGLKERALVSGPLGSLSLFHGFLWDEFLDELRQGNFVTKLEP